jgi:hypothetical protein
MNLPAQLEAGWQFGDELGTNLAEGRWHQARQMVDQMLAVVVIGIVIIVGILVYGEIESSLPAPDGQLADTSDNATNTFGDAMELAPVVLLVIIASLILAVVRRF